MLHHVQLALDDIAREVHREEFERLLVNKRVSAADLDGLPIQRMSDALAGLDGAYQHLLHMGNLSEGIAASKNVFITKAKNVAANGRLIRPPDALRPRTLCTCDCAHHHHGHCVVDLGSIRKSPFIRYKGV